MIDGERKQLSVLLEKRDKALNLLRNLIDKRTATIKEIQKLCGYLNFLTRAIFPGHAFTRRMYGKFAGVMSRLKQHHHISLDREFKLDCKMWVEFLQTRNQNYVNRPLVDLQKTVSAKEIEFYSDASACETLGFGCVFRHRWIFS